MSRTKGSGWGAGALFYQVCPFCGKKKVLHRYFEANQNHFKCTSCKERFGSDTLIRTVYKSVAERLIRENKIV